MQHILITGIQRCGSTFTSHILRKSNSFIYVPEPFNPYYGLEGVNSNFTYFESKESSDKCVRLIDDLFNFKASYKRNYSQDGNLTKIAKFLLGPKANIRYKLSGIFKKDSSRFLIKDPDAAFLSEYISERYNSQVIILIRHPGAVMASFRRLGWSFDFGRLLEREELLKTNLEQLGALMQHNDKGLAGQIGLLWAAIYKVLISYSRRQSSWLIVRHEDLCVEPEQTFEKIFKWSNVKYTKAVTKEILRKTQAGNRVKAQNNADDDITRNSIKLVNYWKESISNEERSTLKRITSPISKLYYDEDSWY